MTVARLRTPITFLTALLVLLLGAVAAPAAQATGGPGKGQEVCSSADGWRKIDGLSGTRYTVQAAEARLIVEVCVKASTSVETFTVDPPVRSLVVESPATNRRGQLQDISHVAVREIPDSGGWFYPAPTCDGTLTVTYPAGVSGNDVNVRVRDADGAAITLNFHLNGGAWAGTKTFDPTTHAEWPKGWTSYSYEWVQVDGTNYHWEGKVTCGGTEVPVEPTPPVEEPVTDVTPTPEPSEPVAEPSDEPTVTPAPEEPGTDEPATEEPLTEESEAPQVVVPSPSASTPAGDDVPTREDDEADGARANDIRVDVPADDAAEGGSDVAAQTVSADDELPRTGSTVLPIALGALLLVGLGVAAVVLVRRRA